MVSRSDTTAPAVPASHPLAAQVEQMLAELQATLVACDVGPLRAMIDSDGSITVFSVAGEPFVAGHRLVGLPAVMVRVDRHAKSTGPEIIFDTRPRPHKPSPRRTAIGALYERWRALADKSDEEMEPAAWATCYSEYLLLQETITAHQPTTARDLAMQMVVETEDFASSARDVFRAKISALASGLEA
ncbi:hypothetical protein [Jiella sp. R10]|uniref:Uncharacterized protein n=2 Tax=Antarcticirhabdus aurantiaca TaxID=2606717 RepID=A0ACD4NUQ9_9HYPH|nr:hypothetical protein OXU80_10540 [Jeongeuplla avenae]